jgi:Ca2+-binding EF-hand superfamily protein
VKKALPVVAALLVWTGALATLSSFDAMDTDRDGAITEHEHTGAAAKMFEAMDANGDGRVTAAEMHAAQEKVTGAKPTGKELSAADKIKAVDADGDGTLSVEEHAGGSSAMFGRMDTDRNGSLSQAEFDAGHVALQKPQ